MHPGRLEQEGRHQRCTPWEARAGREILNVAHPGRLEQEERTINVAHPGRLEQEGITTVAHPGRLEQEGITLCTPWEARAGGEH